MDNLCETLLILVSNSDKCCWKKRTQYTCKKIVVVSQGEKPQIELNPTEPNWTGSNEMVRIKSEQKKRKKPKNNNDPTK